jgi:tetratricopeptide (TPR) repeat protein
MPVTKPQGPRSAPSRPAQDAVERLYVYWLISTGLLILAVLIVAIMTRGTLQRQNAVVSELAEQVTALQQEVRNLQASVDTRSAGEVSPLQASPAPLGTEVPGSSAVPTPEGTARPGTRETGPPATPDTPVPSDSALRAQLDELVGDEPVTLADVTDPEAARQLVDSALQSAGRARWSGRTWSRLAILARLLAQDVLAADFAKRAEATGEALTGYVEVSVRALLARGRAREALPLAETLVEKSPSSPTARVLAAAAFLGADDPASADEVLETLPVPVVANIYDKLLLARTLLTLEHWSRLEAVLSTVRQVPGPLAAERSFLLAAVLAHTGRTVEALAILDGLAADGQATPETTGTAQPGAPIWPWPRPGRYEIEVWRGATLLLAQQPEAARQALQHAAALDPGRPEAQYYLGLLEARAGRPDVANMYLKNALASAPRMVPAWEALASLEINEGEINLALQHLSQAVSINFRRAPAHFLMAIAHAKVSQKGPAAEALQITFHLDGDYLAKAKQTEVLLNLFTPAELDALAPAGLPPEPPETPGDGQP